MEQRFGLQFVIYDREFVARMRRERGYSVNPFTTHTRFLISHALLRDEEYATPLRDWLGDFDPGSLLILDEAHHAAPASSARYAIDSLSTKAIRDLARRFEHRLFLSATPHNGLSNSFSALMEILDPQRFCRGVPIDPGCVMPSWCDGSRVICVPYREDFRSARSSRSTSATFRKTPQNSYCHDFSTSTGLCGSVDWQRYPQQQPRKASFLSTCKSACCPSSEAFARTLRAHRRSMDRRIKSDSGRAVTAAH